MRMEDKENASPQFAATPEQSGMAKPAASALAPAIINNHTASPQSGAQNRFGYTPSPMPKVLPKAQAFTVDLDETRTNPAAATAAAPSAKTLIKELGGGFDDPAPDCAHDARRAPSAKQLLTELQEQSARGASPEPDDSAGGKEEAFTVNFTPQKLAKKPTLKARQPALEKKPAVAATKSTLDKNPALVSKKPTLEAKPAPQTKTAQAPNSKFPGGVRKTQELAGAPKNSIGSHAVATSGPGKKAFAIKTVAGKVRIYVKFDAPN